MDGWRCGALSLRLSYKEGSLLSYLLGQSDNVVRQAQRLKVAPFVANNKHLQGDV